MQLSLSQAFKRWEEMHGATHEGISVAEAYRRCSWVYGAISQIAGAVSQTPFRVYDSERDVESGPLVKLIDTPNRYDQQSTSAKFRHAYLTELLLNGAAMRRFTGISGYEPSEMVIDPRRRYRASVGYDENGMAVVTRWLYVSPARQIPYIPGDDIYHDALYNPYHDWEGLAPLQAAILGINNDLGIGEFTQKYFENDASSGVVFTSEHPSFTQKAADEAAKRYNELHGGTRRAFRAKFLGFGLKPAEIGGGFDAKSMQILRALTKEEIVAGIFKVPLEIFGSRERADKGVMIGNQNPDSAKETFLVNVIMPWAARYDEEFNRDVAWRFGPRMRAAHDFTSNPILERRRLDRARAAAELIDRGVTLNQVIEWLHLELDPTPHGDEWWIQNNMVPASVVMRAGDRALDSATGGRRAETVRDYIGNILRLAETAAVRSAAPRGNGTPAAARIKEIMGDGHLRPTIEGN